MARNEPIAIARLGGPHGVRGALRAALYCDDPGGLTAYGPLHTDDGRHFTVTSARRTKSALVVTLDGVEDREQAAALTGTDLYVHRSVLPDPAPDEYYHADLIGLEAIDPAGQPVGTVVAVHNHGAGDILEVAPRRGPSMLLPFNRDVFPDVHPAAGRISLVRPDEIEVRNQPVDDES